jgi:hypothetical protein
MNKRWANSTRRATSWRRTRRRRDHRGVWCASCIGDHAVRACLAALGPTRGEAACQRGPTLGRRGSAAADRSELGRAIAGEIGSGALGYTAIGEQVGSDFFFELLDFRPRCPANRRVVVAAWAGKYGGSAGDRRFGRCRSAPAVTVAVEVHGPRTVRRRAPLGWHGGCRLPAGRNYTNWLFTGFG